MSLSTLVNLGIRRLLHSVDATMPNCADGKSVVSYSYTVQYFGRGASGFVTLNSWLASSLYRVPRINDGIMETMAVMKS